MTSDFEFRSSSLPCSVSEFWDLNYMMLNAIPFSPSLFDFPSFNVYEINDYSNSEFVLSTLVYLVEEFTI